MINVIDNSIGSATRSDFRKKNYSKIKMRKKVEIICKISILKNKRKEKTPKLISNQTNCIWNTTIEEQIAT